ncbi:MAG: TolC family protein [Blastocatellia bacterium]
MKKLDLLAWIITALFVATSAIQAQTVNVSKQIEERTGHGLKSDLKPEAKTSGLALPVGVSQDDGLTEDEAVAIALWNNPTLQADLTALGLARADVIEAGQLKNPNLTLVFPFSFRVFEALALWPFDAIWQRPHRVTAAKLEQDRLSQSLVTNALDLVRDVRLAYADHSLAQLRSQVATQVSRERGEIAVIVSAQFRAGEISELETNASRVEAKLAEEQAARLGYEITTAKDRLRSLLGFKPNDPAFNINQTTGPTAAQETNRAVAINASNSASADPLGELLKQAFDARPELKAAEFAIEAAGQRAKWERSKILAVSAIAKEYGKGVNGFEQGPGFLIDLPIFHRNQGAISRAEAEIERAAKQLIAARHRIALEVQQAYTQLEQANESLRQWRSNVLPQIEQEVWLAGKSYSAGDVPYLFALQITQRLTDARLREVEFQAALARAKAQLERSVGRRLIANR